MTNKKSGISLCGIRAVFYSNFKLITKSSDRVEVFGSKKVLKLLSYLAEVKIWTALNTETVKYIKCQGHFLTNFMYFYFADFADFADFDDSDLDLCTITQTWTLSQKT